LTGCAGLNAPASYDYSNILNNSNKKTAVSSELSHSQKSGNELLVQINSIDPKLTEELVKIPEIADGIDPDEVVSLESLLEIVKPLRFPRTESESVKDKIIVNKQKKALDKIMNYTHNDGTYNSPLQALFWLIEDGKEKELNQVLEHYTLENLLSKSWFPFESSLRVNLKLSEKQKNRFITMMDEEKQKNYKKVSSKYIDGFFVSQYKKEKTSVPKKLRTIIKNYLENPKTKKQDNKIRNRWKEFKVAVNRLNTPELLDYYEKNNFSYEYYDSGKNYRTASTPRKIFNLRRGNCDAYTTFTTHVLRKAGYKAWEIFVQDRNNPHFSTVFKKKGLLYIFDNASITARGIVGPFKRMSSIVSFYRGP
jgi:hypothetical protein